MEGKDRVLASLLHPKPAPSSNSGLVQEIDSNKYLNGSKVAVNKSRIKNPHILNTQLLKSISSDNMSYRSISVNESSEPTMLELMIAAQAEAKKQEDSIREKEVSKSFEKGFKKGFLSSGPSNKSSPKNQPETINSLKKSSDSLATKESKDIPKDSIPTVTRQKESSLVIDEVQNSMKDDENPILQQLKGGEWITPDLQSTIASNKILASGMSNPKCLAAIQLLQQNPNEAKKRFGNDPEIDRFMQEFGKVMSSHFNALAEQKKQIDGTKPSGGPVQEIGVLQAEVLKKNKQANQQQFTASPDASDARVKEVLENPELRELLLDPKMQTILAECSDPASFSRHMRDPTTAKKIKLLFDAGLVGTTK